MNSNQTELELKRLLSDDEEEILREEDKFNTLFLGAPHPNRMSLLLLSTLVLGIYFVISLFISNVLLLPMAVEGGSMYPTLNYEYTSSNNSSAFDAVYLKETQNVEYKDIVVFDARHYDSNISTSKEPIYYIKRVIATAGDTLQFKRLTEPNATYIAEYALYKNGVLLDEPYIAGQMLYNLQSERFKNIINEEIIVVPDGYVFLMGDNRNNSKDSRELGLISTSDIVGKVMIHIPFGHSLIYGIYNSIKEGYLF